MSNPKWLPTEQSWTDIPDGLKEPKKPGGLRKIRDISQPRRCTSPSHDPPNMIVLEPGEYEYTCPVCGETQRFIVPPKPTLSMQCMAAPPLISMCSNRSY